MSDKNKPEYLMMIGTGGQPDYLLFASKMGIGLGVKPMLIADGDNVKVPGTTIFGARIRSAGAGFDWTKKTTDEKGVVVPMKVDKAAQFRDAWPEVKWEETNDKRASAVIVYLIKGKPDGTPEEQALFMQNVEGGSLTGKMADYLIKIAGDSGDLILTREEIVAWLDAFYEPVFEKIAKAQAEQEAVSASLGKKIGVFQMQADILKETYKLQAAKSEARKVALAAKNKGSFGKAPNSSPSYSQTQQLKHNQSEDIPDIEEDGDEDA